LHFNLFLQILKNDFTKSSQDPKDKTSGNLQNMTSLSLHFSSNLQNQPENNAQFIKLQSQFIIIAELQQTFEKLHKNDISSENK
jgi:hypothetical protein